MNRTIHCAKLDIDAEGLDFAPVPGELGQKIFQTISKQAWKQWVNHQTMLINEYRLNMLDAQSSAFLTAEMQKFLFGEGSITPPDYVAPKNPAPSK